MRRDLVIAAGPGEWRAALLEDDTAVELLVERGEWRETGSIHLGRVVQLVPGLGAALVDIGGDRPGFLPGRDFVPRGRRLVEGERVIVQIRREAQGGKAARLTMAAALRSRHVELIRGRSTFAGGVSLPQKERTRLMDASGAELGQSVPNPLYNIPSSMEAPGRAFGRTADTGLGPHLTETAPVEVLIDEAATLARRWCGIRQRAASLEPPVRLDPAPTFAAALAARTAAPDRIRLDDPAAIPEIRAAFPQSKVQHETEADWPIDLDEAFDTALAPTVALGGATMHIEATRAAVLIDIDSGTPSARSPEGFALSVNIAAARAIARQLRMRNLGGGIVVDFVGLDNQGLRGRVRTALAEAIALDPEGPQILGWTRLGHLELVRPRRGRALAEVLLDPQPAGALRRSATTVAFEALRALSRAARAEPARNWRLTAAPEVAAALSAAAAPGLHALETRLGRKIAIRAETARTSVQFEIVPI